MSRVINVHATPLEQCAYFMGLMSGYEYARSEPDLSGLCSGPAFAVADRGTMTWTGWIQREGFRTTTDVHVAFCAAMDRRPFWEPWGGMNDLPEGCTMWGEPA